MSEKKIASATLELPPEAWFNVDVPSKKIEFCVPSDHKDARTLVNLLYELSLAMMNQLEPPPEMYVPKSPTR